MVRDAIRPALGLVVRFAVPVDADAIVEQVKVTPRGRLAVEVVAIGVDVMTAAVMSAPPGVDTCDSGQCWT